ncbi:dicarboxylate/amino acid:cation symporter [Erythrobacter litoralis]|uniref:Proton glutamate symport protein n=1 Tax=Erythrobacter litoralis (strain HTCC2594) TaxID=314225 RepID=Q2N851_ERYLH|nr:dicarboxylate/amino acid:cation symporter [Erythrobacter litoralis]ABC64140.1 proton glutamate symport protein [Erythrobacter litoralis HTCC2594]
MAESETRGGADDSGGLVTIRLPVWWTFGGLIAGLLTGLLLAGSNVIEPLLEVTGPVGTLWLRALQMTIIPLVAALLVLGITKMAQAARAGATARRMLLMVFGLLVFSGVASAISMPLLLDAFPPPSGASGILDAPSAETQQVPTIGDFIASLIAPNIIQAAAETSTLPLTIFFALFAVAVARLPGAQRATMLRFFEALANTMLTIIGWVLWVAPVGVFALAVGVAARAGGEAFATLAHYIVTVTAMGAIVLVAAYALGIIAGRISPAKFARSVLPAQAVAISTQSSLASLPAMLDSARRLGIREEVADFVLPLAVAIFRATSPAMNMAVAIYVAHLAGVELTPMLLAAGIAVAFVISIGSVSLPGSISFVISIGPIALAMGIPIEPLALLVAVEMLPDIMRTLANVTMNVGLTAAVDREKSVSMQPESA